MTTAIYKSLLIWQRLGKFFHGSPKKHETLRGSPLYATRYPQYAILYAILPRTEKPVLFSFGRGGELRVDKGAIETMGAGYVYVLSPVGWRENRRNLIGLGEGANGMEFVTHDTVNPLACIEVRPEDYPFEIRSLEETRLSKKERALMREIKGMTIRKGFRNTTRKKR